MYIYIIIVSVCSEKCSGAKLSKAARLRGAPPLGSNGTAIWPREAMNLRRTSFEM